MSDFAAIAVVLQGRLERRRLARGGHSVVARTLQRAGLAAPFCRPKLQAVVQWNAAEGKSHADWLAELAKEVDENNRNSLDVNQCGGALKG